MQLIDRKILGIPSSKLNGDDADFAIEPNDFINGSDFRLGSTNTAKGAVDYLESVGSTILKVNPNLPATGTNIIISSAPDIQNLRIVFFLWNSLGDHRIYCYDSEADVVYLVLTSAQLTGGLNFDKYHPIHSAFVLNNCVYWVNENINEPRRLNIDAGIKLNQPAYVTTFAAYTAPLDISIISWIRRQPGIPPTALKVVQTAPALTNNFIQNEAFQFYYRYIYRDFETGTLSGLSNLANFNAPSDLFNRIDVTIPLQEKIQQDVIQIDLVVKYMVSGQSFIINSWQTSVPADATAIANHNAGTAALLFSFYNDKLGIAIDPDYAVIAFDNVPIYAWTCESAKSRAFMANIIAGYNTPRSTSLSVTSVTGGQTNAVQGKWFFFRFQSQPPNNLQPLVQSVYLIDIQNIPNSSNPGFYTADALSVPPFPPSIPYAQCHFRGGGLFDVMNSYFPGGNNRILEFTYQNAISDVTGTPSPPALIDQRAFKSDGPYQLSITFYDYYGRKCGIVTNPNLKVQTPERTYNLLSYVTGINWALDNTNALTEIPSFAYYYSINISKNLRTRFFLQARALNNSIKYAVKDATTGVLTFSSTTYAATNAGVAIDASLLYGQGAGYVFTDGDILKLYTELGNEYIMSVIGQQGNYIICQNTNVGTGGFSSLFEVYTPYKPQTDEPSYEVDQFFPVINPTQASRQYSITVGTIKGDITMRNRNDGTQDYLTECMTPNDKFPNLWLTDSGRPNFIDTIGQQTKISTIQYSDTFINGSKINGLSTFGALNSKDISTGYGAIAKLVRTNKVQKTGSIMLAIGTAGEVASLYLSENVITTTTGETQIVQTSDVIGYVNTLKGSYGTLNPESVIEYKGNVYWFDLLNGKYIQYSDSGLYPISNYKMTKYWKLFSDQYSLLTQVQIEALGSRPFVFSGIDPHNGELMVSVPKLLAAPPKGLFNDYTPAIPYPFDVWDGQAKTLCYKIAAEPNKWVPSFSFTPEGFAYMQDKTYGFKDGNIYQFNDPNTFCNYFGVQYAPKVMVVANAAPTKPKVYNGQAIQANVAPQFSLFRTFYPFEQGTELYASDYKNLEGVWYATLFKDRLTPSFNGDFNKALFAGDKMRSTALYIMHQFDATQGLIQLKFVNTSYAISVGQVPA